MYWPGNLIRFSTNASTYRISYPLQGQITVKNKTLCAREYKCNSQGFFQFFLTSRTHTHSHTGCSFRNFSSRVMWMRISSPTKTVRCAAYVWNVFSLSSFSNLLISYTCTSSAPKMWHALSRAPKCERNIHVLSVLPFAVTIHLLIYSSGQIVEKIVDWYRVIRKKWVNTYIWCTFSDLFVQMTCIILSVTALNTCTNGHLKLNDMRIMVSIIRIVTKK